MLDKGFFLYLFVSVCFVLAISSCSEKTEAASVGKYQFYYYPKMNMYYDVAAGQYIYSIDSARSWLTVNETSSTQPPTLGDPQVIQTDSKQVWKQNEEHRQQYGGVILNVADATGSIAPTTDEVRERKAAKRTTRTQTQDEQKKKGIGKFLENLFGKRKKEQ